jgi:DNA-binding NtrC family response regulator
MEFSAEALQSLMQHQWQGNIRELQNTINRAVLLSEQTMIGVDDLWNEGNQAAGTGGSVVKDGLVEGSLNQLPYQEAKSQMLHRFNAVYLAEALRASAGNVTAAARSCGLERQAFQRLLRRYQIESRSFR